MGETKSKRVQPIKADRRPETAEPKPARTAAPVEKKELTPKDRRKEHAKLLRELGSILGSTDDHTLLRIEAVLLIQRRGRGCNTPIEEFIDNLLLTYMLRDDDGIGMTLEEVEHEMRQLRENYGSAVQDAFFMADRYARPEDPVEA